MLDRGTFEDVAVTPGAAAAEGCRSPFLDASGLTFAVEGKRLVDGIDLRLDDLTTTVVMGANGAGKSLLLRLLHGLIRPTAGHVRWRGEAMSDAIRARQAMVFQRPVLLRRSVAANIDFVLRLKGRADAARRDELLERVGLIAQRRQPARLLSSGEQQRLALARSLATSPEVLFLDEPTSNLDPASVVAIEDLVAAAKAAGTKIIFVTHDLGQARRLADEIVFLARGRLVEQARASDFFSGPMSEAGQAYLDGRILV